MRHTRKQPEEHLCVLVLEDTPADAELTIAELSHAGFVLTVDVVDSEDAFRRSLAARAYDVVLADYRLPRWTAMDALRVLREHDPNIPMILVTGTVGEERAVECVREGVVDYILKQNLSRLPVAIRRALSERQLRAERAATLTALAESESRYRMLLEASFSGIMVSEAGIIREVNQGAADLFGYTMDDVLGRPALHFVAEESQALVATRIEAQMEGAYEFIGRHHSGSHIHIEAISRMHTFGGRPVRVTALRDLTGKRLLEEQFRQAQKMEAVGRLAGGVAHDFNNLITVIQACSYLLIDGLEPGDTRREELDQITEASTRAATLTRQLLTFSGRQPVEPQLVQLEQVVGGARNMLKRVIGEDIELVSSMSAVAQTVRVDPGQLEQVIMNLAVNARDAMPSGGHLTIETGTLEARAARPNAPSTDAAGGYAVLRVSDDGVGMSAETRARIFEPFFTTKGPGKGTGLGLASVYGIVEQSGGYITVASEQGQGTTFNIHFPLVDEPAPRTGEHARVRPPVSGTETVLVAEDDPGVRGAVREILERYGYTVLEAPNGQSAMTIARKNIGTIDLLISDVVMPGMGGPELAEGFTVLRPDARVLFMSGHPLESLTPHGLSLAQMPFIAKPFVPQEFAYKVRAILDAPAVRPG